MDTKALERIARDMHEGKHLRNILTDFCGKNNIPLPQTILPVRKGRRITVNCETYTEANELILSWGGQETATLRVQHQRGSYMEDHSEVRVIPVCSKDIDIDRVFVPLKKSFKASLAHQDIYTLAGMVNGENVSLTTQAWERHTTTLYTDHRKPHSQEHPKKITRLDDSPYWFIVPAA